MGNGRIYFKPFIKTGKGFFGGVDSQIRATLVARKYDETIVQWEHLEQKISVETDETVLLDLTKQRTALQPNLIALTQKMSLYHIPLKASDRSESIVDHDIPKSSIEKLARWGGSDNEPLPLIASASGTTARALITAQELNLFQTAEGIDLKMAQYLASSFCASIVHGGHHSVLEVAEIYNRLLDYHAILNLESTPSLEHAKEGSVEESMPYYRIGDSSSLLPEEIRDAVLKRQEALLTNAPSLKDRLQRMKSADATAEDHDKPSNSM